MTPQPFRVGFLTFPGMTQLDMTGPYEVISRMPGADVHLLWKSPQPVVTEHGMTLAPITTFERCPRLDLICIPGGFGVSALLNDVDTLTFVRERALEARYITSVCTGSLLLGAAGLLKGRRATSHWMSRHYLSAFGAEPVDERVVIDGNLITGGGVTAGIDFGLTIIGEVMGSEAAQEIQLAIEYNPAPPYVGGSPDSAEPTLVAALRKRWGGAQEERATLVAKAAARDW